MQLHIDAPSVVLPILGPPKEESLLSTIQPVTTTSLRVISHILDLTEQEQQQLFELYADPQHFDSNKLKTTLSLTLQKSTTNGYHYFQVDSSRSRMPLHTTLQEYDAISYKQSSEVFFIPGNHVQSHKKQHLTATILALVTFGARPCAIICRDSGTVDHVPFPLADLEHCSTPSTLTCEQLELYRKEWSPPEKATRTPQQQSLYEPKSRACKIKEEPNAQMLELRKELDQCKQENIKLKKQNKHLATQTNKRLRQLEKTVEVLTHVQDVQLQGKPTKVEHQEKEGDKPHNTKRRSRGQNKGKSPSRSRSGS